MKDHGLEGKVRNYSASRADAIESIGSFFESLIGESEEHASRQVRSRLGVVYL